MMARLGILAMLTLVLVGCGASGPVVLRLACPLARAAVEAGCGGVEQVGGEEGTVDLPVVPEPRSEWRGRHVHPDGTELAILVVEARDRADAGELLARVLRGELVHEPARGDLAAEPFAVAQRLAAGGHRRIPDDRIDHAMPTDALVRPFVRDSVPPIQRIRSPVGRLENARGVAARAAADQDQNQRESSFHAGWTRWGGHRFSRRVWR
jgi:hypothetical protein